MIKKEKFVIQPANYIKGRNVRFFIKGYILASKIKKGDSFVFSSYVFFEKGGEICIKSNVEENNIKLIKG